MGVQEHALSWATLRPTDQPTMQFHNTACWWRQAICLAFRNRKHKNLGSLVCSWTLTDPLSLLNTWLV